MGAPGVAPRRLLFGPIMALGLTRLQLFVSAPVPDGDRLYRLSRHSVPYYTIQSLKGFYVPLTYGGAGK